MIYSETARFVIRLCLINEIQHFFEDFSNVVQKSMVKALAEADDQEVVKEVQVYTFSKDISYI